LVTDWLESIPDPPPFINSHFTRRHFTPHANEDLMNNIGIIGTGIAGLHLALYLQQHGRNVTLYGERKPEEYREARLSNTVIRQEHTRARERTLRVHHWDGPTSDVPTWRYEIRAERNLRFEGRQTAPANAVDMRLYEAQLLTDFVARGGALEIGVVKVSDLPERAACHDLLVIASGRGGLCDTFERDPQRSPFEKPQRLVIGGLFSGVKLEDPLAFRLTITPGIGEIFEIPQLSFDGPVMAYGIEAVPGGPLHAFATASYAPGEFEAALPEVLREYAPQAFARVQPDRLRLTGPKDFFQGAVTPVVRRAHAQLEGGGRVMAVGDALAAHDPIVGQGANVASACAWTLGERILMARRFDEAFFQDAETRLQAVLRPSVEWTNSMLGQPSAQRLVLMAACARQPEVAEAFVGLIGDPAQMWAVTETPSGVAGFLNGLGVAPGPLVAN
jgi:Styrene monooxygenase A putative substrate binding domain